MIGPRPLWSPEVGNAVKNTVFNLLPYAVGGGLGWLLFSLPEFLHDLGVLAYLIMALVVAALFLTFLGFSCASWSLRHEVVPAGCSSPAGSPAT
jgi:drug/metabolite transporter (DMT)-like permease